MVANSFHCLVMAGNLHVPELFFFFLLYILIHITCSVLTLSFRKDFVSFSGALGSGSLGGGGSGRSREPKGFLRCQMACKKLARRISNVWTVLPVEEAC